MTTYNNIDQNKKIYKIVLTGGPCAGKTTALSMISNDFMSRGYHVITVSESATELIAAGAYPDSNVISYPVFEVELLKFQLAREDFYNQLALNSIQANKIIVLYDRGCLDNHAYMKDDLWYSTLDIMDTTETELIHRYDGVVHLITSAIGAEHAYTKSNNESRIENVIEAVDSDARTQNAWKNHPNLHVIDNSTSFEIKISRTIEAISSIISNEI